MNIDTIYDYLPEEQWIEAVKKTLLAPNWQFNGYSNNQTGTKFWYQDLSQDTFFTQTLFNKICKDTAQSWSLNRVYANGQTHGLSGELHQDVNNAQPGTFYTLLYYVNPEWMPQWGGTTVFSDPRTGQIISHYPTPNSAVFFDSTIWHAGLEPTRYCTELRVTIAFKLQKLL